MNDVSGTRFSGNETVRSMSVHHPRDEAPWEMDALVVGDVVLDGTWPSSLGWVAVHLWEDSLFFFLGSKGGFFGVGPN